MARSTFGGGIGDFVVDASTGNLRLKQTTLTFWSAASGGTQHTDLLLAGSNVSSIPTDAYGGIPQFQGPDGVTDLWAQAPGGTSRARLTAATGSSIGEIPDASLQSTSNSTGGLITGRRLWAAFAWLMAQFGYPYVIRYNGSWPALSTAPAVITSNGYPILWDSSNDTAAATPPEARDGDYWDQLVS